MAASVSIGLEIGEDQIRAVQLRRNRRGEVTFEAAGTVTLPRDAVAGGSVVDVRLLTEAVRRLARESHFTASSAVVGISGRAAASRVVEVPPMRQEEMRAVVAGEMEHYRMIPAGQGTFDFVPLGAGQPTAAGQVRLLLMAADKRLVDADRETLRLAGLQMTALEPLVLAASRAVFPALKTGGVALVVVGARTTELAVFHDGALQYCRQVDAGALDLASPVPESTMNLGRPEQAEGMLAQPGASPLAPLSSMSGGGSSLSSLLFELRRSLDFYHREAPVDARVDRVLLSLEPERAPDFMGELEETLGLPVSLCQPFDDLPRARRDTNDETPVADAPAFAAAVGLALRGVGAEPEAPTLDLSDTGSESHLAKVAPRWLRRALVVSVLFVAASSVSWLLVDRALQQRQRDLVAKKEVLAKTTALEQQITSNARRAQQAQSIVQLEGLPWSEIFLQISQFVPRGVWVTDVGTTAGTTLSMRGEALSTESVAALMDSLTRSALFVNPLMTSVQKRSQRGQDIVSYEIRVTVTPRAPGATGARAGAASAPPGASPAALPSTPPAAALAAPGGRR